MWILLFTLISLRTPLPSTSMTAEFTNQEKCLIAGEFHASKINVKDAALFGEGDKITHVVWSCVEK